MVYNESRFIVKNLVIISISLIIIFALAAVFLILTKGLDFEGVICKTNEDFWFEEDELITSDGWTFTITIVKEYILGWWVIALKIYHKNDVPYRPINTFSLVDLYIGFDNVKNYPDSYPIIIIYFKDRYVWADFNWDSISDWGYFKNYVGNNHIISHD